MIINFLLTKQVIEQETISRKIIRELKKARYSIWLANIWFTDNEVYDVLISKLNEGLNVEIVLNSNHWNFYENSNIQKFIDAGGEIYFVTESNENNVSNDKYCIVDFSTVINDYFKPEYLLKPGQGASFIKENQETLVEQYIHDYLLLKNNYCINRY
ncbi:MAG: hypothetical protein B6I20_13360 [Bacteroidetes bacterium 4572_117]|nr:MAG: hypothetical protein B6I20_13360 [Bacteroidetes bacterium 4572_117]